MSVSVVVLSYERPHLLAQALPTIATQIPAPDEIIVVDNPSTLSRDVDAVLRSHPAVRLVRPGANLGFAGGMNLGLREARGDFVLLTEDDVLLEPGTIAELEAHLASRPSCALCAAVMLNHERGSVRSAGMHVRLGGVFRQTVLAAGEPDPGPGGAAVAVDAVPGACMFGRRRQLLGVGGFREAFFMYYEDVELCRRLVRRGWTVEVVPAARVRHFEPSGAAPSNSELEFHKMKNLAATYLLHAPTRVLPEFVVRYGLVVPLRTAWRSPASSWQHARAWAWVLSQLPSLWAEREAMLYWRP